MEFHRWMQVSSQSFFSYNRFSRFLIVVVTAIPNRIAVEVFTLYHSFFPQSPKAIEIENLNSAIRAMETKDEAEIKSCLSKLHVPVEDTQINVTNDRLLTALKIHRFSAWFLWKGVKADNELANLINKKLYPTSGTSPFYTRSSAARRDGTPKLLNFD
jgi:hypothetical protein